MYSDMKLSQSKEIQFLFYTEYIKKSFNWEVSEIKKFYLNAKQVFVLLLNCYV